MMLIPDPRAALRGILESLKPGGRLAAAVWGPPDRVPFITLPRDVAVRELDLPAPPEPGLDAPPNPLRLAHPGMLEELFREAGFDDVHSESVAVTFRFASPAEYVAVVRDMSSTMRGTVDEHPEEVRERVWSGIVAAAGRYGDDAGRVALPNVAPCVWGRRK
jgi:SAM-dependent methyltransferase